MSGISKKRKHGEVETKFYAVRAGKIPGVYATWKDCQDNTVGYKGANYKSFSTRKDAQDYVDGKAVKNTSDKSKPAKFYGVAVGHRPGVYEEWTEAQKQVTDIKGPKYKKFDTRAEAEEFVRSGGMTSKLAESSQASKPVKKEKSEQHLKPELVEEQTTKKIKTSSSSKSEDVIKVYTDGSAKGNGKVGALGGVGVYFEEGDDRNVSEPLQGTPQTNQRAELTAVLRALQIIPLTKSVLIYTDSNYSINCSREWYKNWMKNGWKSSTGGDVQNRDLIQKIRELIDKRDQLNVTTNFQWVKGHGVDAGNKAADKLAVAGAIGPR